MLRKMAFLIVFLSLFLASPKISESQIIRPTGNPDKASSQLIYFYSNVIEGPTVIQVTNTNDVEGVWIHVQIFRSFDTDGPDMGADPVICDERDFADFLTPNDTHIYDLGDNPFNKNINETDAALGDAVNISLASTEGFIVITPIVSDVDFTAISFQHLIGDTTISVPILFNAMGRDAVDFGTGAILPDGTPLDGVTNGFTVLQPDELFFDFNAPGLGMATTGVIIAPIVFDDVYGPPGLLGYQVLPSTVTWQAFIFDFNEDPTSCGNKVINCYDNMGLNDTFVQGNNFLGTDLLCSGSTTPATAAPNNDVYGWTRIFISNLGDFTNHITAFANIFGNQSGMNWVYAN